MKTLPADLVPGVNPALCPAGTHCVTARIRIIDGRLFQLWVPADAATHGAEWREVESEDIEFPVHSIGELPSGQ